MMTPINDEVTIRPFLGLWRNTASETLWLKGFNLSEKNNQLTIHPQGICAPFDWGKQSVESFRFHGNESAFYSRFSLLDVVHGEIMVDLMAYTNIGLIVVATHLAFVDAPGRNHLSREFFVPSVLGESS
jgi:hypothetical protein